MQGCDNFKFEQLVVYQKALDVIDLVYKLTSSIYIPEKQYFDLRTCFAELSRMISGLKRGLGFSNRNNT
ncbi:MAG TPA: hypothetical protein ENN97_04345 [Phycisphaerales bacterium]|nr:hypothetical protein [Phycisphaerales bacterium]